MKICEPKNCTGCMACKNICSKQAISMTEDSLGCLIPQINEEKCIACGLCQKICPAIHSPLSKSARSAYAVWSKNEQDVAYSSSGGAAAVFTRAILERGGIVCGCTVMEGSAQHICIDNIANIEKLRGSKYVQSYIGDCYKQIKDYLEKNREVLFIGTPCQVAGLQSYLQKHYPMLTTVDIICHGTPPQRYLREHLSEKAPGFDRFSFRGMYDFKLTAYRGERILYQHDRREDIYFAAFLDAMTYRDCCYMCQYARPERVSDLTVGDFWGIDRDSMIHSYSGKISVVLPNTEKGVALFEACQESFVWEERTQEEAVMGNGNLCRPSRLHPERKKFTELYPRLGFTKAVARTNLGKEVKRNEMRNRVKKSLAWTIAQKIKSHLRYIIEK